MIIVDKKPFLQGITLLVCFFILFSIILTPIFPDDPGSKINGLQYSDKLFNELSKGSSWFIPEAEQTAKSMLDKNVNLNIRILKPNLLSLQEELLKDADAKLVKSTPGSAQDSHLKFKGDLGKILLNVCQISERMYNNEELSEDYQDLPPTEVAQAWWYILNPAIKELQRQGLNNEASAVDRILRRALEPANNYYGIDPQKVGDNIFLVTALLLAYVIYTLWYGVGIYKLFKGLGLMNEHVEKEDLLCEERD